MSYCSATDEIMKAALDRAFAISDLRPDLRPRIVRMQLRQFPQNLLGTLVLHLGGLDHNLHDLIAALILTRVEDALLAQAELLPALRPGRDLEQRAAVNGGHFDLGAQSRLGHRDGNRDLNVVAFAVEEGRLLDAHGD